MRKTLFVTLDYPPSYGGVGRMYEAIAREMGNRLIVWAPPSKVKLEALEYELVRKPILADKGWPRWLKTIFLVRKFLLRYDIGDVIVGQALPLGTVLWLLSKVMKVEYYVFVHGMDMMMPSRYPRKQWLIGKILNGAKAVLAANQNVSKLAQKYAHRSAVRVIYPFPVLRVEVNHNQRREFRKKYSLGAVPVLLTTARLVERKGIDVVLEALPKVWRRFSKLHYVVIGEGSARQALEKQAATLQGNERVRFLGSVPDSELAEWLALSDIFIMTPKTLVNGDIEGVGMVYLEAGLAGLPVIGSRHGGVPEVIQDEVTGLLVPENDPELTAEAIIRLVDNKAFREQLGTNGRRWISENFSATKAANMIREIIQND